jgi:taurine dioxygenase
MTLEIRPLSAPLGAEIVGLDMREPIVPEVAKRLHDAFEHYHVLIVRGQTLNEAQQVNFAGCFGVPEMAKQPSVAARRPEIMVISNVKENGELVGSLPDGEIEWHFDRMHQTVPNIAAVLHAVEIPDRGGETSFCDTSLVYDSLPADLQQRLDGFHVACSYDYEATRGASRVATASTPKAVQPLVRRLWNGRKSVFCAPLMVDGIVELPQDEGTAILADLYSRFGSPANTYEHAWRIGDTLIWDNRCCAHQRADFDAAQRRFMRRVAISDFSKN